MSVCDSSRHGFDSEFGSERSGEINPGGVFVVLHEDLTHERTKPDSVVISRISLSMMDQDMAFNQGFIADSMLRVGFKSVRSRMLGTDWGPMNLDIGRK